MKYINFNFILSHTYIYRFWIFLKKNLTLIVDTNNKQRETRDGNGKKSQVMPAYVEL